MLSVFERKLNSGRMGKGLRITKSKFNFKALTDAKMKISARERLNNFQTRQPSQQLFCGRFY